jgi:hypothetical protein
MSRSSDDSYRELADILTPPAVSRYLAATKPWRLDSRREDDLEMWSLLRHDGEPLGQILLPLATDFADFRPRFFEALRSIGIINDWSAAEVERNIARTRADMLVIRLDQQDPSETIPLKQADATLDAIYQMLKHAAVATAAPGRVQRGGRLPSAVSAFLDENVRLGHTKPGSFIFTVVSRLEDPPELGDPAHEKPPLPGEAAGGPRFSRRVLETLARGLETTRDLTRDKHVKSLESLARQGVSAGLIESLETIAAPDDLRSVTLQFEWASALPAPSVGRKPIRLEHAEVADLVRVRELLLREEEPPHRETLFGHVISLSRDGDSMLGESEAGSAVLAAEVNGRRRNVHLELAGADHDLAIKAYQLQAPLIVTGDLVFEKRAWRLTGDIEIDARLLDRPD